MKVTVEIKKKVSRESFIEASKIFMREVKGESVRIPERCTERIRATK